jgi:hypothetical protein
MDLGPMMDRERDHGMIGRQACDAGERGLEVFGVAGQIDEGEDVAALPLDFLRA